MLTAPPAVTRLGYQILYVAWGLLIGLGVGFPVRDGAFLRVFILVCYIFLDVSVDIYFGKADEVDEANRFRC